jgi:hypothetical protein
MQHRFNFPPHFFFSVSFILFYFRTQLSKAELEDRNLSTETLKEFGKFYHLFILFPLLSFSFFSFMCAVNNIWFFIQDSTCVFSFIKGREGVPVPVALLILSWFSRRQFSSPIDNRRIPRGFLSARIWIRRSGLEKPNSQLFLNFYR